MPIFRFIFLFIIVQYVNSVSVNRVSLQPSAEYSVDVSMPGIEPDTDEQLLCFAVEVLQPGFIVEFVPITGANRAQHMVLYGCEVPGRAPGEPWNCLLDDICKTERIILYAWARNAPSMSMPEHVGVPIGKDVGIHYFVLKVHYISKFTGNTFDYSGVSLQMSSQQPQYIAGIYLFSFSSDTPIPAETKSFSVNMSCTYNGNTTVHPFAYRTHTNGLGRIVSAYKHRDEKFTNIGKGNPQWLQMFYPVDKPVVINGGDKLVAQCTYDSSERHVMTEFGVQEDYEMCNFYMYYYVDADKPNPFGLTPWCTDLDEEHFFDKYSKDASTPLVGDTHMTEMGMQSEKKFGRSNAVQDVDDDSMTKKSHSAIDADVMKLDKALWPQLILILPLAIAMSLLLIVVVCCCVRFKKQGGFHQLNLSMQGNYHRNGKKYFSPEIYLQPSIEKFPKRPTKLFDSSMVSLTNPSWI